MIEPLRKLIPAPLSRLISTDTCGDLLERVDVNLLLLQDRLIDLANGNAVPLVHSDVPVRPADELAEAARALLGPAGEERHLTLLLPPTEFVATSLELPGVTAEALQAAYSLQQESVLPACDRELALTVHSRSVVLGERHIGLWLPQERLQALYESFAALQLEVLAVRPRLIAGEQQEAQLRIIDRDASGATSVVLTQGVITQWLQVGGSELNEAPFLEQWEQELRSYPTERTLELTGADDYIQHLSKQTAGNYWFFPPQALANQRRVARGRRLALAGVAVLVLGVLATIPFLIQAVELSRARAQLAESRSQSVEARADQQTVVQFERDWGPVNDFPEQNLVAALYTLQAALSPDRLVGLELSQGQLSIEGTSEDPQAILQRLEQDPLFTEVGFARATNNNRYYIDLRLSPVNFEAYLLRYFPD